MRAKATDADDEYGELLRAVLEHYGVQFKDREIQMIRCPLHEDRTPSCSVNLRGGVWKCHSCGEEGGVYKLIMLKEGVQLGRARAIATDIAGSAGSPGRGSQSLPGSSYAGRGPIPAPQGDQRRGGGYRPSWRR